MLPSLLLLPFSFEPLSEVSTSHQNHICEKLLDSYIQRSVLLVFPEASYTAKSFLGTFSQFPPNSTATFFLAPLLGYSPCPGCPGLPSDLIQSYESVHHICSNDPKFIYSTAFFPWTQTIQLPIAQLI